MTQYIIRRFLQMIPIAFGILTLVFSLIHLIPGDPARQIAGENAREEDVQAVRKALGLDQPLWAQYVSYLSHVVRGDFGRSFQTNEAVSKQIEVPGRLATLPFGRELHVVQRRQPRQEPTEAEVRVFPGLAERADIGPSYHGIR